MLKIFIETEMYNIFVFERSLLCSPWQHLFDKKYSKNSNFSILTFLNCECDERVWGFFFFLRKKFVFNYCALNYNVTKHYISNKLCYLKISSKNPYKNVS